MTPEQLKSSILYSAIQGKLVEQRPEEGSAEEQIDSANKLKIELERSGVLKGRKTKALLPISDDLPFDLPENWRWVRLGTIVEIFGRIGFRGYTKNDIVNKGEGAITMSPSNISQDTGEIDFSDSTYLSWEKYDESPEIMLELGDIVLVKTGSSYGKCGIIKELPEKATINPQLAILKFISCDKSYLNIALKSPMARSQYEQLVAGTSIPTFSQEKLANMYIPLPPFEEQRRIVARIEEILPYVDRYAEAYEKLEQFNAEFPEDMKKSILQYAIQGKLVEQRPEEGTAEELYQQIQNEKLKLIKEGKIKKEKPLAEITDDEIPFDIPETWKWYKLGSLFAIERGSSPRPIKDYLTKADDGVNWIKIGDSEVGAKYITSTSEKITPKGAERSRKVEIGDFIISNSMSFGRPYIMAIEGYVHDGWNIIHFLTDKNGNDLLFKDYIYYLLSSDLLKQQIVSKAAGGVVLNIRSDNLKELIVPIPPMEEQKRIVAKIEELLPYCDRLTNK